MKYITLGWLDTACTYELKRVHAMPFHFVISSGMKMGKRGGGVSSCFWVHSVHINFFPMHSIWREQ